MKLKADREDIFGNVKAGEIFKWDNNFWVALHFDYDIKEYPSICIDGPWQGDEAFLDADEKVEVMVLTN